LTFRSYNIGKKVHHLYKVVYFLIVRVKGNGTPK
jgi:hypothetical protein